MRDRTDPYSNSHGKIINDSGDKPMFQNQEGYNALIFDERNIIIESGKHRVYDPIQVKFGMKIVFNCRPYKNEYPVFEICFLDSRSKEWLVTQPISLDMPACIN